MSLRAAESRDVAAAISTALDEQAPWSTDDGAGGWRPVRADDICILLPARTSLAALESAPTQRGSVPS